VDTNSYTIKNPCDMVLLASYHIPDVDVRGDWSSLFQDNPVDKRIDIALAHYKNIEQWTPKVGDLIIKHGWIIRTKWFGIVNYIHNDGSLDIIIDGMIKLLVTSPADTIKSKSTLMTTAEIKNATSGTFAIQQSDSTSNSMVWYV